MTAPPDLPTVSPHEPAARAPALPPVLRPRAWRERRQVRLAAREMWDALCRLEAALRRPLPDVGRQTQTVMQRGVELQAAWDRHASILAQHLPRGQWWVVERANSPRADATTTAWQQRLRAGREALAPYID